MALLHIFACSHTSRERRAGSASGQTVNCGCGGPDGKRPRPLTPALCVGMVATANDLAARRAHFEQQTPVSGESMPPQSRQNSSDQATGKKCLCLRPSSLLAAVFLVVAAVVLAYLGGVMSGRAYWKAHPQPVAARPTAPANGAVSPATAPDDDGPTPGGAATGIGDEAAEPKQKVLAAEELRFSRVLRNDAATGDAPLKPLPPMTPVQAQARRRCAGRCAAGRCGRAGAAQPAGIAAGPAGIGALRLCVSWAHSRKPTPWIPCAKGLRAGACAPRWSARC